MFGVLVQRARSLIEWLYSKKKTSITSDVDTPLLVFEYLGKIFLLSTKRSDVSLVVYEQLSDQNIVLSKKQITKNPFSEKHKNIFSGSIQQYRTVWYLLYHTDKGSFLATGKSPWNWGASKPIENCWDGDVLIPGTTPAVVGGLTNIGIGNIQKTKSGFTIPERSQIPVGYNWHSAYGDGVAQKPLGAVIADNQHIAIFIRSTWSNGYGVSVVFCDTKNPQRILWRGNGIIGVIPDGTSQSTTLLGVLAQAAEIRLFWRINNKIITRTTIKELLPQNKHKGIASILQRIDTNPIISPTLFHSWENVATFNPAAFVLNDTVHILYRAIGDDGVSRIGYAKSTDGIHIDERYPYPIYSPDFNNKHYSPLLNMISGSPGGYGRMGCEDPRVTVIGDTIYLLFAAYNGYEDARAAYTSISVADFLAHRFNWAPIIYLSAPPGGAGTGLGNKSVCILPEKHNGKHIIYHRMWPNICIDVVENLIDFSTEHSWLSGQIKIPPRPGFWDSGKLGIGAPPIKTNKGWLIIYQGVSARPYERGYLMGAMLCDLNDPGRVIARGHFPVLIPQEPYEINGCTPHVIYPCGAVVHNEKLLIYYGAADTAVAVAQTNLQTFLQTLLTNSVTEPQSCELHII